MRLVCRPPSIHQSHLVCSWLDFFWMMSNGGVMTNAVIGCDDGLHHDRFNLQESKWDGLLYIRSADAVLPYGITIFPYTFHYDATGFLCYVYNEIDGSSTPWGLYNGLVPVVHLPPSLVKSTEIERDTVYRAVCRDNTGIDLTVHCRGDDGDQFFFPYEHTTDVRSTFRPPPRRQCQLVALLARAHSDGDWRTFRRWINRLRVCPSGHTLRLIHYNPKNHVLIPYLDKADRNPVHMNWYTKMTEILNKLGVIESYRRFCCDDNHTTIIPSEC